MLYSEGSASVPAMKNIKKIVLSSTWEGVYIGDLFFFLFKKKKTWGKSVKMSF